jgi:hypothetical protein
MEIYSFVSTVTPSRVRGLAFVAYSIEEVQEQLSFGGFKA